MTPSGIEPATFRLVANCATVLSMRTVKSAYVIKFALNFVLLYLGTMTAIPDLICGIYFIFAIGSVAHPFSYSMGADHTCICG